MGLRGKGMLITFTEVRPRDEADFNEWYNREHIDERVNLPGFRRARRYVGVRADPKYFATYECSKVSDLADPGYLKLLANQTPWSQRVMRRFTKFQRLTLRIRADLTHGVGGALTCVQFVPNPNQARALAAWLKQTALPAAIAMPGMVGACAAENDLEVANAPARAQGLDYPQASAVTWVALLEGGDPAATAAAAKAQFTRAALAPFGVAAKPVIGTYRLMFGNYR
jgi:hypothetical protein